MAFILDCSLVFCMASDGKHIYMNNLIGLFHHDLVAQVIMSRCLQSRDVDVAAALPPRFARGVENSLTTLPSSLVTSSFIPRTDLSVYPLLISKLTTCLFQYYSAVYVFQSW